MAFRDPVIVKLECPIMDMGQEINSVTIRRHATGADVRAVAGLSETEAAIRYVELLCVLPPETVDSMWSGDLEAVIAALTPFVSRTLPKPKPAD